MTATVHRFSLFTIFFLAILIPGMAQTFSFSGENVPFPLVMEQLEADYGFLFSYKEDGPDNLSISVTVEEENVHLFFQKLLYGSGWEANVLEGNFVVITQVNIPAQQQPSGIRICGSVTDEYGSLPGATIRIQSGKVIGGLNADAEGRFDRSVSISEKDTVIISYLGHIADTSLVQTFFESGCRNIHLSENPTTISSPVMITDYLTDGIDYLPGEEAIRLRPGAISALPGQPEPDVLRTLRFLPGISSPSGELSNLYVRGGTPDQNLILWEGIPVYHAAHYFGMISGFNPFAVENMEVYRGGFGVEYGGRTAGLVSIKAPNHHTPVSKYGAGMNMLNAHAQGQTVLGDGTGSFSWSIRRSIADLWESPTFLNITQRVRQGVISEGLDPYDLPDFISVDQSLLFVDGNAKASVQLKPRAELSVAWFGSLNRFGSEQINDQIKNEQLDTLNIRNQGFSTTLSINLDHWEAEILGSTSTYTRQYEYLLTNTNSGLEDLSSLISNDIQERQLSLKGTRNIGENGKLEMGTMSNDIALGYVIDQSGGNRPVANQADDFRAFIQSGFASYSHRYASGFKWSAGIRLNYFSPRNEWYPEPRANLRYQPLEWLTVSAQAGRYRQFLSHLIQFQGETLGIQSPVWVLSGSKGIPVIRADHAQAGLVISTNGWVIDIQGYRRWLDNLTSLSGGIITGTPGVRIGTGEVTGLDILIKKRWKNLNSWISYSLSKVEYRFPEFQAAAFPADHDQRHRLHVVNQLNLGPFELSIGWMLRTGGPTSPLVGITNAQDPNGMPIVLPLFGPYNSFRLPVSHQLNLSALVNLPLKNEGVRATIGGSMMNVYNRENTYDVTTIERRRRPMQPPGFVTVPKTDLRLTPNAVIRVEF